MTGTVCQTPTFLSRCLAGFHVDYLTAFSAASLSPVFGMPFCTQASVTFPFLSIKNCIYTVPSMPASCAISGYAGLMGMLPFKFGYLAMGKSKSLLLSYDL